MTIDYDDVLPGATHWSLLIRPGRLLRMTDLEGGANVSMLFYNPLNLLERYNAPDTLKCQHTFRLTQGHCLYSDMGRIFCSVIEDTVGWHDTACGTSTAAKIAARWGAVSYQEARNGRTQNGADSFLNEAAKYGTDRRDLPVNVNWFSRVSVGAQGGLLFAPFNSKPGDRVTLEMDTPVLLHTCPHPLDSAAEFPRSRSSPSRTVRRTDVGDASVSVTAASGSASPPRVRDDPAVAAASSSKARSRSPARSRGQSSARRARAASLGAAERGGVLGRAVRRRAARAEGSSRGGGSPCWRCIAPMAAHHRPRAPRLSSGATVIK